MKTLNMPGFRAEASLHQTSGSYRSVAAGQKSSREQRVIAQLPPSGGGGPACVNACYTDYFECNRECSVWGTEGDFRFYCNAACVSTLNRCSDRCRQSSQL
jgi:hypothetical protein